MQRIRLVLPTTVFVFVLLFLFFVLFFCTVTVFKTVTVNSTGLFGYNKNSKNSTTVQP